MLDVISITLIGIFGFVGGYFVGYSRGWENGREVVKWKEER